MKRVTLGVGALLAVLALTGCQTAQGFGQDVSTAGRVIQKESAAAM